MRLPLQITDDRLLDVCGEPPSWSCEWVLEQTESDVMARAADWLFARPLSILTIVLVAWVANRLLRRGIRRMVERLRDPAPTAMDSLRSKAPAAFMPTQTINLRQSARAETVGSVLRSVGSALIWTTAGIMILAELGIAIGPLVASAGIAGVALGFGAQSLVKDFLSGIFMILEDQYGVGDIIDVGEATGVVEAVTLRSTRLRSVDGTVWHVPNGEITRVGNMSQQWSRALLDVEVAYDTDLRRAREVIQQVADDMYAEPAWATKILEPPEIWGIENLGASGIAIRLVIKTLPAEQWAMMRELRIRLKEAFDAEGIEIPFPQRTVWVRRDGDDAPADDSFDPA
ncbi:MAG TPA: mechanosensitive ion channel family protein [Acidimicrobiales bacterium]|nr:mechanosensitive ion channel family protein [Acidimicrobiales bacterium]